jgi:hypothetical protein
MSKYGPRVYKPALGTNYTDHPNLGAEWHFKGKKDAIYTVEMTPKGFTCDCPGMVFRGKCRHTVDIADCLAGPYGWMI